MLHNETVASAPAVPVRFLDLVALHRENAGEYLDAARRVIERGHFVGGEDVAAFERDFAAWIGGGAAALGCANGTEGITIAARALCLPEGSEAILPAMTFFATAEGLLHAGHSLRLVDISEGTWLMDVERLEAAITPRTRLIVPVHLYGQMAAMDAVRDIASRHNCFVLEDAAQAHGAKWRNKGVGEWSDLSTFSLYPGKNLGAFGDGGVILSREARLLQIARELASHGGARKYVHDRIGFNSRLDNLQAAILNVKLKYIDDWNDRRRRVAGWYREKLASVPYVTLPVEHKDARHVYHLFVVLVEDRDRFMAFLKARGIETGVHYPAALHQLPALAHLPFAREAFPVAEKLARHGVSLPMCPTLCEAAIDRVAAAIKEYYA